MSKSEVKFYTVRGLMEKGFDPIAIRYALIAGVYGKPYNFTDQGLVDAMANVERLRKARTLALEGIEAGAGGEDTLGALLDPIYSEALGAMTNDLNTPVALAKALEGAKLISREESMNAATAGSALRFVEQINSLLGVVVGSTEVPGPVAAPADDARIDKAAVEGVEGRKIRDFDRGDRIRDGLVAEGIELRDSPEGTSWSRKASL